MTLVHALAFAAAAVNLWGFVDCLRHDWRGAEGTRGMWASLTVAGVACGVSTAPALAPVAVYLAFAYVAGHASLQRDRVC